LQDRYQLIEDEVICPRRHEREAIAQNAVSLEYLYEQEVCSVRRKEFWPLYSTEKLLNKFMEELSHPADGVILQGQCSC
jgi:mRNA capping enzyme, catalytic domain